MKTAREFYPVSRLRWRLSLFLPASVLLLASIGFWASDWDRRPMSLLYREGDFLYRDLAWVRLTYDYSTLPALVLGIAGLLYAVLSFIRRCPSVRRTISLSLLLTLLLGPGLVVNAVFKEHYGRPRPFQTEEFGGTLPYQPVWVPGSHEAARSFPSGHSSMGFFFFIFYFIAVGLRQPRAYLMLWFALIFGSLIGLARMMQGAHWPSDVLWSWGMVYYCAFAVAWVLHIYRPKTKDPHQWKV